VIVIGLCAPWALIAYGVGWLLVVRHRTPTRPVHDGGASRGGWLEAVQLYQALSSGQPPPMVYAPDLPGVGTVHMDVPFRFSRWFGLHATYRPGGMVAVGPPSFVAGAAVGRLIGTSVGYTRAAREPVPSAVARTRPGARGS
jgi:hypothetical protein